MRNFGKIRRDIVYYGMTAVLSVVFLTVTAIKLTLPAKKRIGTGDYDE